MNVIKPPEGTMQDNIFPYPCTDCQKGQKRVHSCSNLCTPYLEWFGEEWDIVTRPFREIKRKRDERNKK